MSITNSGYFYAPAAFLIWGFLPVYWKSLSGVESLEIMCHRLVWSLLFTALLLGLRSELRSIPDILKNKKTAAALLFNAALISGNWLLYIWAVNSERVLETSLGYYINPLINVLLGWLVLKDGLNRRQGVAVGLAALGVLNLVVWYGKFPWVALTLALTFGSYGLVRKLAPVGALSGLFVETLIAGIPAALYLGALQAKGSAAFLHGGLHIDLLLIGCGIVTTMPLLLFAMAAKRLRLATLGIFQYMAPTGMFLLGVFAYDEPFTTAHMVTFLCIWTGIAMYTWDGLRKMRKMPHQEKAEGSTTKPG
jgi:chloramphenicol-sensitive protein RarD